MRSSDIRAGARITAIGEHRPARVMTNDDLAARGLDTSDEWIRSRTGITQRHVAAAEETVISMGMDAAAKALAGAGLSGADIDLVILATCTMRNPIPGGAARIATGIGAVGVGAFDLNAACGGFCYALSVAADAVRSGGAARVVATGSKKPPDGPAWKAGGTASRLGEGPAGVWWEGSAG